MSTIQFDFQVEQSQSFRIATGSNSRRSGESGRLQNLDLSESQTVQLQLSARLQDNSIHNLPANQTIVDPIKEFLENPATSIEMQKLLTLLRPMLGDGADDVLANLERFTRSLQPAPEPADLNSFTVRLQEAVQDISARAENVQARAEIQSEVRVRFEFYAEDSRMVARVEGAMADPLVLDLNGDGLDLTSKQGGADFDINADGRTDRTAWVGPEDGLLALDRNGNGSIDDGSELFGDQHGATDGFSELARFDENGDGLIDVKDKVFARLLVWRDLNGDGTSGVHELSTLADLDIHSIDLNARDSDEKINDAIVKKSSVYTKSGTANTIGEVFFEFETTV